MTLRPHSRKTADDHAPKLWCGFPGLPPAPEPDLWTASAIPMTDAPIQLPPPAPDATAGLAALLAFYGGVSSGRVRIPTGIARGESVPRPIEESGATRIQRMSSPILRPARFPAGKSYKPQLGSGTSQPLALSAARAAGMTRPAAASVLEFPLRVSFPPRPEASSDALSMLRMCVEPLIPQPLAAPAAECLIDLALNLAPLKRGLAKPLDAGRSPWPTLKSIRIETAFVEAWPIFSFMTLPLTRGSREEAS